MNVNVDANEALVKVDERTRFYNGNYMYMSVIWSEFSLLRCLTQGNISRLLGSGDTSTY